MPYLLSYFYSRSLFRCLFSKPTVVREGRGEGVRKVQTLVGMDVLFHTVCGSPVVENGRKPAKIRKRASLRTDCVVVLSLTLKLSLVISHIVVRRRFLYLYVVYLSIQIAQFYLYLSIALDIPTRTKMGQTASAPEVPAVRNYSFSHTDVCYLFEELILYITLS